MRTALARPEFHITVKEMVLMAAFWLLIFIEPLTIGSVKISQIWKVILVAAGLAYVLRGVLPAWFLLGLAAAFKYLFYSEMPYGIDVALGEAAEAAMFPVLVLSFMKKYRQVPNGREELLRFSVLLSIFFIYSAVPFLFGLKGLNPEFDLSKYGLDRVATKGLFYQIASASQTYCVATVLMLANYRLFWSRLDLRIFFMLTVALGIYLTYGAFARTAWIMLAIGVLMVIVAQPSRRAKFFFAASAIIVGGLAFYKLASNEAFILRLAGGAVYRQDVSVGLEPLLQSRVPFIMVALDNLNHGGLPSWLIGHGTQSTMDQFEAKTSMSIVSHNGVMEQLESTGVIGLALYLLFIVPVVFRVVSNAKHVPAERPLAYATAFLWSFSFLVSHGLPVYAQFMFIGIVARSFLGGPRPQDRRVSPPPGFATAALQNPVRPRHRSADRALGR